MLATILIRAPLVLFPLLGVPEPPRDCQLELLTPQALEERTLGEFDRQVMAFVTLHRQVARSLPPAHMFLDDEGGLASDELRESLVAARPLARPGAFFTPAVAELLKRRIDDALLYGVGSSAMPLYEPLPGEPAPTVNQPFPSVLGSVRWPARRAPRGRRAPIVPSRGSTRANDAPPRPLRPHRAPHSPPERRDRAARHRGAHASCRAGAARRRPR